MLRKLGQQMLTKLGQQMLRKLGQQMLTKIDRQLFHTIATDGRLAGANRQMFLTHTIAFCHAWPILLSVSGSAVIPLLASSGSPSVLAAIEILLVLSII